MARAGYALKIDGETVMESNSRRKLIREAMAVLKPGQSGVVECRARPHENLPVSRAAAPVQENVAPAKKGEKRETKPKGSPMPEPKKDMTREQWLHRAAKELERYYGKKGHVFPEKLRISCGWPSNRAVSQKSRSVGQCWSPKASSDGATEIFISPYLDTPEDVIGTLAHELCHAVVGTDKGHGKEFRLMAEAVGLEGQMTATRPGPYLRKAAVQICEKIGGYPHKKLDMAQRKKQSTRLLKVVCPNKKCEFKAIEDRPYSVRMSNTVLAHAAPQCGMCGEEMKEEPPKKK